jgi:GDP-4-dehydro-6-deoxy-D-mannose reductase
MADSHCFFHGDLLKWEPLNIALRKFRPDFIFHLAGTIRSENPEIYYRSNVLGTLALFEGILGADQHPRVILAGTGAVYGSGFGGRPISERFRPRPVTHYAVSKLAQEMVALRYFDAFKLPVVILRIFNLIGPGQSPALSCSAFARQIALAEAHGKDEIMTGELSARRDFIDVRDATRAFALLAEKGQAGQIYNVCSGRAVLIRKCLDEMLSLSSRQFNVHIDAGKRQTNDIPVQVGNANKLKHLTGWHPQISLKQSLADLLADWRQRVKLDLE